MKESLKNKVLYYLFVFVLLVCVGFGFKIFTSVNNVSFEKRLEKLGLYPTEQKYIYVDKDGNIYHCVPASAYRQEVIERM